MTRKLLAVVFVVLSISGAVYAQRGHAKDLGGDYFGEEAFGRPMKLIAGSYAPEIIMTRWPETDCTPESLDQWCFGVNPDLQTTKTLTNNTHIVIPAKSVRDVLFIEARNWVTVYWRSDLPYNSDAMFLHQPTITIKSPALTTPITANMGRRRIYRLLTAEESWIAPSEDSQYARTYRLTRGLMKQAMGMTDAQIDMFFDNDITIEFNYQVRVKQVDISDSLYDLMIFGY